MFLSLLRSGTAAKSRIKTIARFIWSQFVNKVPEVNMPRARRRNHSRSRSRSRSGSYDRDVKRRRLGSSDSIYQRGSFSSERAQRSRQHERGTSAERRYKRSHRRSPTSNRRNQHRHRRHRSYSSSQVGFCRFRSGLRPEATTTASPLASLCALLRLHFTCHRLPNTNWNWVTPNKYLQV